MAPKVCEWAGILTYAELVSRAATESPMIRYVVPLTF